MKDIPQNGIYILFQKDEPALQLKILEKLSLISIYFKIYTTRSIL